MFFAVLQHLGNSLILDRLITIFKSEKHQRYCLGLLFESFRLLRQQSSLRGRALVVAAETVANRNNRPGNFNINLATVTDYIENVRTEQNNGNEIASVNTGTEYEVS